MYAERPSCAADTALRRFSWLVFGNGMYILPYPRLRINI